MQGCAQVLILHVPGGADTAVDGEIIVGRDPVGHAVAVAVDRLSVRLELLVRSKPAHAVDDIPGCVARGREARRPTGEFRDAVGAGHLELHQFARGELQAISGCVRRGDHRRLFRRIVGLVGGHDRGRHGRLARGHRRHVHERSREHHAGLQKFQHKGTNARLGPFRHGLVQGVRLASDTCIEAQQLGKLHGTIPFQTSSTILSRRLLPLSSLVTPAAMDLSILRKGTVRNNYVRHDILSPNE